MRFESDLLSAERAGKATDPPSWTRNNNTMIIWLVDRDSLENSSAATNEV